MRTIALATCLIASSWILGGTLPDETEIFRRGDANNSGVVDAADGVWISNYLFSGGAAPPCMNQADVNADGAVNVSDSAYLYNWLYSGGPAPPAPGPYATTCSTTSPWISCDVLDCD